METLGVAEIVVVILDARKVMSWATAASVSRERRDDAVYVRVTLLERAAPVAAGGPVDSPGRGEVVAAFTVRQFREDLAAAFGHKDMIILK